MTWLFRLLLVLYVLGFTALVIAQPPQPQMPMIGQGVVIADIRVHPPAEAVHFASVALTSVPANQANYVRFLSIWTVPPAQRQEAWAVLGGHINGMSREVTIVRPHIVPNTDDTLAWIDIRDYGWDTKTWESLATAQPLGIEPYFHVKLVQEETEVVTETRREEVKLAQPVYDNVSQSWRYSDIREVPHQVTKKTGKTKTVAALAPWLSETEAQKKDLAYLVNTTQSSCPIVNGEWFFWLTATSFLHKPNYYDFLKIKTQKDFEDLVGFDRTKINDKFTKELRSVAANSGVSRANVRRIARYEKVGGSFWQTFDVNVAIDKKNAARVLDNAFAFDASEFYSHLPNDLWALCLADKDGVIQDRAPDFVGFDHGTANNDGMINIPLSCIRCHADGGLKDIKEWVRNTLRKPLGLQSPDYNILKDLTYKYLRHLEPFFLTDRTRYTGALFEATGMTPKDYAAAYNKLYNLYDRPRGLTLAAVEVGCEKTLLQKNLRGYAAAFQQTDVLNSTYLRDENDAEPVPVDQFQEDYSTLQFALRGFLPNQSGYHSANIAEGESQIMACSWKFPTPKATVKK